MDINGKTVIITGSTGKLASQIVLSLAEAGANCICVYHKNKKMANTLEAVIKKNGVSTVRCPSESRFVAADLTKPKDIEKIFTKIEKFSQPEILINAAAVFEKKNLKDLSCEYICKVFDINFTASMLMTQKFVEFVKKSKMKSIGRVINIIDVIIQRPPAGFSVYSASKAALAAATKSLAKELAPDFTVNAVSPGIINWQKGTSAKLKKKILARIPAGRTGSPQDVAQAVKFLIENDYITGQIINIDGGVSI